MELGTIGQLLLYGGLFFLMMRFGCGSHMMGRGKSGSCGSSKGDDKGKAGGAPRHPARSVDPVCGEPVTPEKAKPSVFRGEIFHFCSRECRERFEAAPELYASQPDGQAARPAKAPGLLRPPDSGGRHVG